MCFGVRFSLYLASCLPDVDLFFFCVCGLGGGGNNVGTRKKGGGDQPKKGGDWSPCSPPPPGSAYDGTHIRGWL